MRYLYNWSIVVVLMCVVLFAGAAHAISEKEVVEKTTVFLEELDSRDGFSGAVLIAKDGVPIFRKAYGYANRSFDVPNQIDTKFNLGSMNKMFTATVIMQLVEKGKIKLDGKIIDYVRDYPNKDVASKVTIHQLLSHTGGLGNYWTPEYMRASKDLYKEVEDYLPLFVNDPLLFEPGSQFSYSNAGFMVLGLIIEKVTGENYFDYVRENVYKPAGMINTDAYETDYVVPNLAIGYTRLQARRGELKNNLFLHVVKGGPAGGGYSTVEDLNNFANALMSNKLMSKKSREMMTSGKAQTDRHIMYCYGFRDRVENGHHIVGHTGGFPGIAGYLGMFKGLGYTVAVLSNYDNGTAEPVLFIEELLVGETQRTKNRKFTEMLLNEAIESGYDAAVEMYEKNKEMGVIAENTVNLRGYRLLEEGKVAEAISVLRMNVYLYPESANVYDSLGEAYMIAGNTALAIENYEKSLALDSSNENAREKLAELRK
ncbi:MAG: serine hydrolase [candidate division WOR-3 bacterium]|nr:MAG: serine hydrolase [candidate division WOR-3 bacterium]